MTALQASPRTAETYIAGFGASGALLGGAIVAFVMLVGVVTFNSWPQASGLFTFSGGQAELTLPAPAAPSTGEGATLPPLTATAVPPLASAATDSDINGREPGPGNPPSGVTTPEVPDEGVGAPPPRQPASSEAPPQSSGSLVSSLGNTVERSTSTLGDTVNEATGTNLGNVVSGAGETLNGTLQDLSGTQDPSGTSE